MDQYLSLARAGFRAIKAQADKALAQVSDEDLVGLIDPEANSIAVLMRHMAGNMRSRWTDFLTSDGEKPGRNRDGEFEAAPLTREAIFADWESGWACLFATVDALNPADLARTVTIRNEASTAAEAIDRQIRHYSEHTGQIVLLAKHFAGQRWSTLSIPKKRKN